MGRPVTDRIRRVDESHYLLKDIPNYYVTYEGRTDSFDALTSDPVWQIKRIVALPDSVEETFANDSKYNCVWDNRSSYFDPLPPLPPGPPSPSTGLSKAGRISIVSVNETDWLPVPPVALADRNAIAIQNFSGAQMKIQYDDTTVGYIGVTIADGNERQYDITEGIILYGKLEPGAGTRDILVEELS